MSTTDIVLRLVVAAPLGLAFGSFLTMAVHRVPEGGSVVRPRSRCPSCGTQLRAVDNVPVLSWLALRGRCRACGVRIPVMYPLIELASGGLFAAVALTYEDVWQAILLGPFLGLMVALSVIDIRHKRIPNALVYPALLLSGGLVLVGELAGDHLDVWGALIGFLAYGVGLLVVALIAPAGMGMGDVKLAGLIGLVLGGVALELVAVAAGLGIAFGGVGAMVALAFGAGRKTRLPYGPFMAAGAGIAVFFGRGIVDAYLRLIT